MSTEPQQLLEDAELVDLVGAMPREYEAITASIQQACLRLLRASSQAQWVEAVRAHGGERDALAAARAELADVTCRLENATRAHESIRKAKDRLRGDSRLSEIQGSLAQQSLAQASKQSTLANAIQQAERDREAKVRALVDDGVPEPMALSVARPNLAEIDAMRNAHDAIPAEMAELSKLLRSSAALVRHAYPEAVNAA